MEKLIQALMKIPGVDERSASFLVSALTKNNLPGFDYLEFKQSLVALESLNMDEHAAFQAAFATASTMGLTKAKLLETANFYKKILANEQGKFEQALQQQTKIQIAGKQKEITNTQTVIEQKKAQIDRLHLEIANHEALMEKAQETIETSKHKIFSAKENFEKTYVAISGEVNSDVDKITTIL
ncbi:MAG: hypothetical protein ACI97N_000740 [Cognaticolwellia sp.]|jgi:hypothetical protein